MVNRWVCAFLALAAASWCRAEPPGRIVEETWETAHIDGVKVGFSHTTVQECNSPGGNKLRSCCELDLTFRRQGSVLRLHIEQGTEETSQGRVVGVFMRQGQEGGPRLELVGELEDGKMHVRVDGGRIERRLPWSEEVVGWHGREHLFQKRQPKAGDRLTFRRYEPTLNCVTTVRALVKGPEEVAVAGGKRKVLRVDMTADRIEVPGHSVVPPGAVWWLDDDFLPVRKEFELEGLGTVVLTRSSKAEAQAPGQPGRSVDLGLKALVPLNRTITRPYESRSAVYRITLAGDPEPGKALASSDSHQEIVSVQGDVLELHVHPPRSVQDRPEAGAAPAEYLASCHYIDCDDPRVRSLARRAAGDETDPWRKARRIERWVKQVLRVDATAPFGPASQTARDLRGDCRHFALLTAALCRAEGLPARTAVGLLYVEKGGRPYVGFHMWTEVWVAGQWLGVDATLGRGGVSAAHLKIADAGWNDVQSLTPLLPVGRILGKVRVEVVRVEAGP
jgi:hypothetical protein